MKMYSIERFGYKSRGNSNISNRVAIKFRKGRFELSKAAYELLEKPTYIACLVVPTEEEIKVVIIPRKEMDEYSVEIKSQGGMLVCYNMAFIKAVQENTEISFDTPRAFCGEIEIDEETGEKVLVFIIK